MSFSQAQLVTLKTYLDAESATYAALNDQDAAVTLNALSETRIKASLTGVEVFEATDSSDFTALTDAQKAQWLSLCAIESMDPSNGGVMVTLAQDIFAGGASSATAIALIALRNESISPATEQGLPLVRADNVRVARTLP